jgi:hypothetical protein
MSDLFGSTVAISGTIVIGNYTAVAGKLANPVRYPAHRW